MFVPVCAPFGGKGISLFLHLFCLRSLPPPLDRKPGLTPACCPDADAAPSLCLLPAVLSFLSFRFSLSFTKYGLCVRACTCACVCVCACATRKDGATPPLL